MKTSPKINKTPLLLIWLMTHVKIASVYICLTVLVRAAFFLPSFTQITLTHSSRHNSVTSQISTLGYFHRLHPSLAPCA